MIRGIESFKKWFKGYEEYYTIIGGTACDLLMTNEGLDFRATKDLDLVLIVEVTDILFGQRFWEYITSAEYEHRRKSTGKPQFYRFQNPKSTEYPAMIELFTRKPDTIVLPKDAVLSPLPIDEEVSGLSAILLNDDYYNLLRQGQTEIDGISILDAPYLIPFKAKAWMDLFDKKAAGERADSKDIRKHKNDVFRLAELLNRNQEKPLAIPREVFSDMREFADRMKNESVDLKQLGVLSRSKEEILDELLNLYTPAED